MKDGNDFGRLIMFTRKRKLEEIGVWLRPSGLCGDRLPSLRGSPVALKGFGMSRNHEGTRDIGKRNTPTDYTGC